MLGKPPSLGRVDVELSSGTIGSLSVVFLLMEEEALNSRNDKLEYL